MLRTTAKAWMAGAGVVALLALAGCGGGDDDSGANDGVASISDPSSADTGTDDGDSSSEPPSEAEVQQAALDFAACMREHGVDMPDPEFSEGGGVGINVGGEAGELDPATMDAAQEACQHFMDDVTSGFEPDPEQQAEMQERALAHAQCMRDHGVENFPDPQFQDGGGVMVAIGEDSGIDPESPEFQEAQEACDEEFGPDGAPQGGGGAGSVTNEDGGEAPEEDTP